MSGVWKFVGETPNKPTEEVRPDFQWDDKYDTFQVSSSFAAPTVSVPFFEPAPLVSPTTPVSSEAPSPPPLQGKDAQPSRRTMHGKGVAHHRASGDVELEHQLQMSSMGARISVTQTTQWCSAHTHPSPLPPDFDPACLDAFSNPTSSNH
jgi:hypothetical protein